LRSSLSSIPDVITVTPFPRRSLPQLLAEAARGGLRPPPAGRLRRVLLHLSHSMTTVRLLDAPRTGLLSKVKRDRGVEHPRSVGSPLQWHAEPGTVSGACVAAYLPFDRPPSLRHLRRRFQPALFDASTVLLGRPTPRLFRDSFVSSTSCHSPSRHDCGPDEVSQVPTRSFWT
jgi:hypothetical protein